MRWHSPESIRCAASAHKGGHMRVVIASDAEGMSLKEIIKDVLIADGHEVVDYS